MKRSAFKSLFGVIALTMVTTAITTVPFATQAHADTNHFASETTVPGIAGIWMRASDELRFRLKQSGMSISAEFASQSCYHKLTGAWNAADDCFDYTVIRTNATGVTEMYGHLYVLGRNTIRTVVIGTDGRSDLPKNYHEDSYWSRQ